MEATAFLAGAATVTAGLAYLRVKREERDAERKRVVESLSAKTVVRAPFVTGAPGRPIEHVTVPHLRDYFKDLETFDRCVGAV
jgi:hypothetical protein